MNDVQAIWVRVLLLNNITKFDLTSPSNIQLASADEDKCIKAYFPQDNYSIIFSNKGYTINGTTIDCNQLAVHPNEPFVLNVNGEEFRGNLKIIKNSDSNSFDVINHVPLEPYLAGVVGAEMPSYWEPEALKAQAVACRTYCLYTMERFGQGRNWDLSRTQSNQVYSGIKSENKQVWDAVNATESQVLVSPTADGEKIFPTYYSSSCGGHTEDSKAVFGKSFDPIEGVPCTYCRHVAKPKSYFWPEIEIAKKDAQKKLFNRYPQLRALEDINDYVVDEKSRYDGFSRATKIKLIGTNGKFDFLRAEDFRLCLDSSGTKIKSTVFDFVEKEKKLVFKNGRGWGHGVGLCQCGTQYLARKGKKAEEILNYYFPDSLLTELNKNKDNGIQIIE